MSEDNKRLAILDELDKFNTAPQADSLMLGILQEEEANQGRFGARNEEDAPGEDEPEAPLAPEDKKPEVPNDYLPLNTSIQDLNGKFENRFSGLERSIQSLAQSISQSQQPRQQAPEQNYDPDMPVTGQHMQVLAQRQEMAYNMGLRAYKQNLSTRAHLELQRFQTKHPDFQMDSQQLDFAIDAMARDGKLDQLEGTNWRGHFEQMYVPQRESRYDAQAKQIETLQKELESLKKTAARSPAPAQPVSPSTGRSSRGPAAISTPLQESNEDSIVGLKTFRQKGNFKGFANDLKSMGKRRAGA